MLCGWPEATRTQAVLERDGTGPVWYVVMNTKKSDFHFNNRKTKCKRIIAAALAAALTVSLCADSGVTALAAEAGGAEGYDITQNTIGGVLRPLSIQPSLPRRSPLIQRMTAKRH